MDRAVDFFTLPVEVRQKHITRIMKDSLAQFNHSVTARNYIDLYEQMLHRPFINPEF